MTYCGSHTVMGHGENAVCGQPYIGGIYQCQTCQITDLKAPKMKYTDTYAQLQRQLHSDQPSYGTSGANYADYVSQLAGSLKTRDILDYGCGKSTLQKSLPFPIKQYDPFIAEFASPPVPAQLVVCTDVLEHIEPVCLDDVLEEIARLTLRMAFFQIATGPAKKFLADGRNAHICQMAMKDWFPRLIKFFDIQNLSVQPGGFIAIATPFIKDVT